ncbi:MAG TPA: tRNA (adenosine(37)-N6)-dimethylallyltransferase MiaA [Candidatus Goldiibacteriota bacterium]|nr:tRNA (adenosine(37)-N6)-dimethylallyltransferase MiaA [Candidatus Goldiibacteriota bacterium]HRQ44205.1 tRNA (adenosine(37)-N6)-dimethylallyltransferase MiaA [Candidatus Goldiibacteriota bacterium]
MFMVICGPTASGKSAAAVETAVLLNGEIISADSMQIYRGMDIGTNKISKESQKNITHHLIDIADPKDGYSAAMFKKDAEAAMDEIKKKNRLPIICGGTGLYIDAIIKGLAAAGETADSVKEQIRLMEKEKGADYLYALLKEKDPQEAAVIDRKNPRRLIRAMEIIESTGRKVSDIKKETAATAYKDRCVIFVINAPREVLYSRIDRRVDEMVKAGLFEEVESLLKKGVKADSVPMQAIGYKEAAGFFAGGEKKEEAIARIKQATRNYAKRQLTWFKRYKDAVWIDSNEGNSKKTAGDIIKAWKSRQ